MGKRKTKLNTLTKIDPSVLISRPPAVSQHVTARGTRVTTTVRPGQPPVIQDPPLDSAIFDTGIDDEHLEDGGDDVSKAYYVSRVCLFPPFRLIRGDSLLLGQPAPTVEENRA
jgi:hypothetical protein